MAQYKNNAQFATHARMITALAFVPAEHVKDFLDALAEELPIDLRPLRHWFEDTYVGRPDRRGRQHRPHFAKSMWTVYNCTISGQHRTNNHAEAVRRGLQVELSMEHPSIWHFKESVRTWNEQVFQEGVNRLNSCVLYVDTWGGHRDSSLYGIGNKLVLKVLPESSTSILQPSDLYCFRRWKDLAKRCTEDCLAFGIRVDSRNDVLKLQSLIYNQFQHPEFRPLCLYAWRKAGFEVPVVPFLSLAEILFTFDENCFTSGCPVLPFIKCINCKKAGMGVFVIGKTITNLFAEKIRIHS